MELQLVEPLNLWLCARDVGRSKEFYSEKLGLPLWREEPGEALHYGLAGAILSLHRAEETDLPPRGGWLVFTVASGIDGVCEDLRRRGIAFEQPLADRAFGRSAMFRDPDGHELWVCQPSATETQFHRWELAHRSRLRKVPVQRRPKVRRHEPRRPTHRRHHPVVAPTDPFPRRGA